MAKNMGAAWWQTGASTSPGSMYSVLSAAPLLYWMVRTEPLVALVTFMVHWIMSWTLLLVSMFANPTKKAPPVAAVRVKPSVAQAHSSRMFQSSMNWNTLPTLYVCWTSWAVSWVPRLSRVAQEPVGVRLDFKEPDVVHEGAQCARDHGAVLDETRAHGVALQPVCLLLHRQKATIIEQFRSQFWYGRLAVDEIGLHVVGLIPVSLDTVHDLRACGEINIIYQLRNAFWHCRRRDVAGRVCKAC